MEGKIDLREWLLRAGVPDPERAAALMLEYRDLTLERNEIINLTTVTDADEFIKRHFIDSLACYGRPEIEAARSVVDVGTGAGFPGVPLAVAYPDKDFLLIDSLGKRTSFIEEACGKIGISNVRVLHARAEDAARAVDSAGFARAGSLAGAARAGNPADPAGAETPTGALRESFDLAVSRAVAHLSVLCEYCLPFVRTGGAFYAYKSRTQLEEIGESRTARLLLGAAPEVATYGDDRHVILVINKQRPTPATYPRKAGTPSKIPL